MRRRGPHPGGPPAGPHRSHQSTFSQALA